LDKEISYEIIESRRKERQDKQARIKTLIALTIVEKQDKNQLAKQQANFIVTWSSLTVKKVS
jgi:hypothetical protein